MIPSAMLKMLSSAPITFYLLEIGGWRLSSYVIGGWINLIFFFSIFLQSKGTFVFCFFDFQVLNNSIKISVVVVVSWDERVKQLDIGDPNYKTKVLICDS